MTTATEPIEAALERLRSKCVAPDNREGVTLRGRAVGRESRCGWFKAMRTQEALELVRANPLAFVLLYVMASRAKWREGFTAAGLDFGECFLGDHDNYGMTQQQYRTAKRQLADWGFATFKSTNKGTVGKLSGSVVFDVLPSAANKLANEPANNKRRTEDRRAEQTKETGGSRRPISFSASKEPSSIGEVVALALTQVGGFPSSAVEQWLERTSFDRPAKEIVADLDCQPEAQEAVQWALRFTHFNNLHGWDRLTHSWRAAFTGFVQRCDHGAGPADVPLGWIPHIAAEAPDGNEGIF